MERGHPISIDVLRLRLDVDFNAGKLFWKPAARELFNSAREAKRWNTRYAGKEAFTSLDGNGYKSGSIWKNTMSAHRVIWAMRHGEWPEKQIDHIDGNRLNNAISNLRSVTNRENSQNRGIRRDNTTGVVGVVFHKRTKTFDASIFVGGRQVHLGCFRSLESARRARREAEREYNFHPNHGRRRAQITRN